MFLKILTIASIVAASSCFPASRVDAPAKAKILEYTNQNDITHYKFGFSQSDGTSRSEEGGINPEIPPGDARLGANRKDDPTALHVVGGVTWTADDGGQYEATYVSGTYGFRTIIKRIS